MGGDEGEAEREPVLDVDHAGHEQEQRRADQQQDAEPLEPVGHRANRRALEERRDDRPELRQQDRDRGEAGDQVQRLGERVEPGRLGRPGEEVEVDLEAAADVVGAERRVVGGVGEEAGQRGDDDQRQQGRAEERRQPLAAQRAAPEAAPERADVRHRWRRRRAGILGLLDQPAEILEPAHPECLDLAGGNLAGVEDLHVPVIAADDDDIAGPLVDADAVRLPHGRVSGDDLRSQIGQLELYYAIASRLGHPEAISLPVDRDPVWAARQIGPVEQPRIAAALVDEDRVPAGIDDVEAVRAVVGPGDDVARPGAAIDRGDLVQRVGVEEGDLASRDRDDGDGVAGGGDATRLLGSGQLDLDRVASDDADRVAALVADEGPSVRRLGGVMWEVADRDARRLAAGELDPQQLVDVLDRGEDGAARAGEREVTGGVRRRHPLDGPPRADVDQLDPVRVAERDGGKAGRAVDGHPLGLRASGDHLADRLDVDAAGTSQARRAPDSSARTRMPPAAGRPRRGLLSSAASSQPASAGAGRQPADALGAVCP